MREGARLAEVATASEATETAAAAILRAEKDLSKTGQNHRRGGSTPAATAAKTPYFSGVPAAVAAVPVPTG